MNAPIVAAPPAGRTVDYGKYLVTIGGCLECHGARLAGAAPAEPGAPPGRNLTPGGNIGQWSEAEFINTLPEITVEITDDAIKTPVEMPAGFVAVTGNWARRTIMSSGLTFPLMIARSLRLIRLGGFQQDFEP